MGLEATEAIHVGEAKHGKYREGRTKRSFEDRIKAQRTWEVWWVLEVIEPIHSF